MSEEQQKHRYIYLYKNKLGEQYFLLRVPTRERSQGGYQITENHKFIVGAGQGKFESVESALAAALAVRLSRMKALHPTEWERMLDPTMRPRKARHKSVNGGGSDHLPVVTSNGLLDAIDKMISDLSALRELVVEELGHSLQIKQMVANFGAKRA